MAWLVLISYQTQAAAKLLKQTLTQAGWGAM